jgi:cholesterol transport system auxiliary component
VSATGLTGLHGAYRFAPVRALYARSSAVLFCMALVGCGSAPLATFDLSAPRSGISSRTVGAQVIVTEPVAVAPLDTDRIIVRSPDAGMSLLKDAQWSDRLPQLVQSRLIQTFENGKSLRAVGRPGDKIIADYSLVSEIRKFEIDAASGEAVVEMSVKLVGERNGRIVAARIFDNRSPGSATDGAAASASLDRAMGAVLRDIVGWASAVR